MRMRHAERFALNQWLAEYPQDATYDEVFKMVLDGDERIAVWERLEGNPNYVIADVIEETKFAVENMLNNLLYGVALMDKTEEQSRAEGAME
jgi:hypothetical protein